MELVLARHKKVLDTFPDAKSHYYSGYSSKTVNQCYTSYIFESDNWGLYVLPRYELDFNYEGQEETIKISSSPARNKLAYLSWRNDKKIIRFARFAINQKNHQFKEDMLNACKAEIMLFIKNNPGYQMDDKHLEPRLKKLLLFT